MIRSSRTKTQTKDFSVEAIECTSARRFETKRTTRRKRNARIRRVILRMRSTRTLSKLVPANSDPYATNTISIAISTVLSRTITKSNRFHPQFLDQKNVRPSMATRTSSSSRNTVAKQYLATAKIGGWASPGCCTSNSVSTPMKAELAKIAVAMAQSYRGLPTNSTAALRSVALARPASLRTLGWDLLASASCWRRGSSSATVLDLPRSASGSSSHAVAVESFTQDWCSCGGGAWDALPPEAPLQIRDEWNLSSVNVVGCW
mmetsp:Transcript_121339/g.343809  ORF Transcript_121339/g.343809 Transcript_121339/m.343809 type:complete len:261 (+) Transcript_121339:882-1664(+)